jgi:hypothetical protein
MGATKGRIRQEDIVPFIAFEEISPVAAIMEGADQMKIFVRQFLQFQIAGLFPLFDQGQALMQKLFDVRRGMKNPGSFIQIHFLIAKKANLASPFLVTKIKAYEVGRSGK